MLAAGLVAGAWLFGFALRLLTADRVESRKSAARATSVMNAIRGRFLTKEDWIPDARVKAGMVYNTREQRIEITGRLSDDSFDRVFGSPSSN